MTTPQDPAAPQPARQRGMFVPLLALVAVMLGVLALRELASLVVPVVFGLFVALVAWPLVGRLERRGASHRVALAGAILVVLVVVLVAAVVIGVSVAELVLEVPKYEDQLLALADRVQELLAGFGISVDPEALVGLVSAEQIIAWLRPVASAASSGGLALLVLVLTMLYALTGGASLQARAEATFGGDHRLLTGMEQFGVDLRKYLVVRAQLGVFAAILSAVLLVILGVPFAFLWAFLVFAASFIPNIGTFIALIPPTILALLDGGLLTAGLVIAGYTLINVAQDQFLQPIVMGSELNLSPLVVFLSVLAWAWILGPAGALLAVPLTVGLVAILEQFPSTVRYVALLRNRLDEPPGLSDLDAAPGPATPDAPAT